MYDPVLGRFLQRDAYAGANSRPLSLNRYGYVMGNPVNLVDPTGFCAEDDPRRHCLAGRDLAIGAETSECLALFQDQLDQSIQLVLGIGGGPSLPTQRFVDDLVRSGLPTVSNPKLANIVRDLFKGFGSPRQIGNGSTMDAIRSELATGGVTEGINHWKTKGPEYVTALSNWLARNPSASAADRHVGEVMLQDLIAALSGH
jgi:hypothetical protein